MRVMGRSGPCAFQGYTDRLLKMTEQTINQEDKAAPADDGVWTTTPEGERIPNYEATFPDITEGQVVTGARRTRRQGRGPG